MIISFVNFTSQMNGYELVPNGKYLDNGVEVISSNYQANLSLFHCAVHFPVKHHFLVFGREKST